MVAEFFQVTRFTRERDGRFCRYLFAFEGHQFAGMIGMGHDHD